MPQPLQAPIDPVEGALARALDRATGDAAILAIVAELQARRARREGGS